MGSFIDLRREAKAEIKAEKAALKAKLEGIAGQLFSEERRVLILLLDGPLPSDDYPDAIYSFDDLELIKIDNLNETFSLSPLGKEVAEFINGLPYHQFINVDEGSKFDENRPLKETAKLIKQEIRECVKKGILPEGKYSVRSSSNDISIEVRSKTFQFANYGFDESVQSTYRLHQPSVQ